MNERIKCVITSSADGQLAVRNLCQWAKRRRWSASHAAAQITGVAAAMGCDAIPGVNLATMVNVGTQIEPTYILELDDVSAFVLASGA